MQPSQRSLALVPFLIALGASPNVELAHRPEPGSSWSTTIVTEMLERHPDVTSHRYSDFPNVWTPYWRNHLLQQTRREAPKAEERAHKDRIRVSNDSPEAVEEVLWMHFFRDIHDEAQNQVLEAS